MTTSLGSEAAQLLVDFENLTTPHVADACIRRGVQVRCAPWGIRPLAASSRVVGRVRPVRHSGSVDVFLEALDHASPGEVLVVDNGGRQDEGCIGDLIALETKMAGLAGIVIWGLHRDSAEVLQIGLPMFSLGTVPAGPLRLDPPQADALMSARIGAWTVTTDDVVMGDANGVVFVPLTSAAEVAAEARGVRDTEQKQARKMRSGASLRAQLRFSEFLARRSSEPGFRFRDHLRGIGGAVEE